MRNLAKGALPEAMRQIFTHSIIVRPYRLAAFRLAAAPPPFLGRLKDDGIDEGRRLFRECRSGDAPFRPDNERRTHYAEHYTSASRPAGHPRAGISGVPGSGGKSQVAASKRIY